MQIENSPFLSAIKLREQLSNPASKPQGAAANKDAVSFQEIFSRETAGAVKFSKHAAGRLADRNITLSESQIERLNEGAVKAGAKGIRETLVLIDQMAFIVNIPNKTVVTALNENEAGDNVFTNIDGAVII